MNTVELIQDAATRWLTVPAASAMNASEVKDMLIALNAAQASIWRGLPAHYRRMPVAVDFYGPATGTVVVYGYGSKKVTGVSFPSIMDILTYQGEPILYQGEPLMFNGSSVYENPRPYCSMDINGDKRNVFDGTVLRYPYFGRATGTQGATLYHDSSLLPILLEQIITEVRDRVSGCIYQHVLRHQPDYQPYDTWSLRRIQHHGVTRSLVELKPGHDKPVILEFDAFIAPIGLTLGSSMRAVDLPYDAEVGGLIVAAAGAGLATHRLFDRERHTRATALEAGHLAMQQLREIPGQIWTGHNLILTPEGY
jgi:hypothetical protein